jgi:hypothetical protein
MSVIPNATNAKIACSASVSGVLIAAYIAAPETKAMKSVKNKLFQIRSSRI